MHMCICVCVSVSICCQKRGSDVLELEVQVVVNNLIQVLETKLRSNRRAISTLQQIVYLVLRL